MGYSSEQYLYLFDKENSENILDISMHTGGIAGYRTKTYKMNSLLECEIFPVWKTCGNGKRAQKYKPSRTAQETLNFKNARKKITRLLNNNFSEHDMWITVGYDNAHLPDSWERAHKDIKNYIAKIKRWRNKNGKSELRYLYVTEWQQTDDKNGAAIRCHHHIVLSGDIDRDTLEKMWTNGGRRQARRLQPDDYLLTGLAHYLSKGKKNQKKYGHSNNLKMPIPTVSDHKISRKKAHALVMDEELSQEIFENAYKGYALLDMSVKLSDYVAGVYINARMRRT